MAPALRGPTRGRSPALTQAIDPPPAPIVFLQKRRLILEPAHHEIHHTAPYDKYYCITSGVLNELLDKVDFFKRTERLVTRVSGVLPRVEDLDLKTGSQALKS